MIQTINEIVYGDRSEKTGKIKVEVRQVETPAELLGTGNRYLVVDWDITSNGSDALFSKYVFYTNEQIDALDQLIEANYQTELSGLSKSEKESKKLQLALMHDTQTNLLPSGKTIYRLTPNDWEFTPPVILEEEPEA